MIRRTLIAAVVMVAVTSGWAQGSATRGESAMPSDAQLRNELQRVEAERKGMFRTDAKPAEGAASTLPSKQAIEQEMRRIEPQRKELFDENNPDTTRVTNSFPNIDTPAPSQVDLEALAERYGQKAAAKRTDGLLVFVSLSMPAESLKKLIADTARAGGAVVMNGFYQGSIAKTGQAMNALGQGTGGIQVNPNAFTKYRVTAVPAVVLTKPESLDEVDNDGCALPGHFAKVSGDVSLSYALEHIASNSKEFGEMATRYARPLIGALR